MRATVFGKGMMAAFVALGLVLGLGACGVKSSPQVPEGTSYPRQYPYAGPQPGTPAPSGDETGDETGDEAGKTERGPRSPLGFPLEYPNRPSYQ